MMKFELITAEGQAVGNVELDLGSITQIQRSKYGGRDRIDFEGGWFFVSLDALQLAAIYRVLAAKLETEAKEAEGVVKNIR